MGVQLQRSLDAVPAAVPELRGAVAQLLTAAGIGEPLLTAVKIAVSEAVTNVVMHAYIGAERPGPVRLEASLERDRLFVEVSDDGGGYRPRLDSPGLGVGLLCIADKADAVDITTSPGGGTQLRMSFAVASCAPPRA
ncbi:MAG: ATP-binding protein [Solirubrobacteraceae bacterium]|nr:ATP-binding protein [Solirubrobacteraceae bacterium]